MTYAANAQSPQISLDDGKPNRVVDTCCRGCVFAQGVTSIYKDQSRFLQSHYGCEMGVLEKMQANGETITDCEDEIKNEFHVIEGRVCPFYRVEAWVGMAGLDSELDMEMMKRKVREEASLQYDAIVYFTSGMDPNDVIVTMNALSNCNIQPKRVYIVNTSDVKPSQFVRLFNASAPLPWRMETTVEDCDPMRALDIISKKCESMFMVYFTAGYQPHPEFFDGIDSALYDELDKFIAIEPLDYRPGTAQKIESLINGLVVMRVFYKQVGGCARSFIVEKTRRICEEQECPTLLRRGSELISQPSQ